MAEKFEVGQRVFVDHTSTNVLGGQEMYQGEAEVMQVRPDGWLMIRYYDKPTLYQVEPKFVSAVETSFYVGQEVLLKRADPLRGSYTERAEVLSATKDNAVVKVLGRALGETVPVKMILEVPQTKTEPEVLAEVPQAEDTAESTVQELETVDASAPGVLSIGQHKLYNFGGFTVVATTDRDTAQLYQEIIELPVNKPLLVMYTENLDNVSFTSLEKEPGLKELIQQAVDERLAELLSSNKTLEVVQGFSYDIREGYTFAEAFQRSLAAAQDVLKP